MKSMTQAEMAAWDAGTFEVIMQQEQVSAQRDRLFEAAHRMAGDKKRGYGRTRWLSTDGEVLARLREDGDEHAARVIAQLDETHDLITALGNLITEREAVWKAGGCWSRYFPCLNADGHIHSSLRGCPTVRQDTQMSWATELSGKTVAEAVAGLGETLCSVCFPEAPAGWCRTRSEVTRAEREAARDAKNAARDAARAAKNLAEPFETHDGERVTTVAAAKTVVRKPAETAVELEWYRSGDAGRRFSDPESLQRVVRSVTERLEGEKADMRRACEILLSREAAAPGTGWTQEEAGKAVASAAKRARRAYFG